MKIIPELKQIVDHKTAIIDHKAAIYQLVERLEADPSLGTHDLRFEDAHLVCGCQERDGHLYRGSRQLDNDGNGPVNDLYYSRKRGSSGCVYFKTEVPGRFVAVPYKEPDTAMAKGLVTYPEEWPDL